MKNGENTSNVKVPNTSGAYIKGNPQKQSTAPKVTKGGDLRSANSNK